jgi:hypothetical protein
MENSPVPTVLSYMIYDLLLGLEKTDWNSFYKKSFPRQRKKQQSPQKTKRNIKNDSSVSCYVGKYFNPAYGTLYISEYETHFLKITHNNLTSVLQYIGKDTFESINQQFNLGLNPIKFRSNRNSKGEIESVSAPFEPKVKDIVFIKIS